MRLPGGFSPTQALHTVADKANPFDGTDTDYDVFGDISVRGGDRSPANGAFIGPQVKGASTNVPVVVNTGGGGGGNNVVANDPYARYGGEAAFNALRSGYGATQEGYEGGARTTLRDVGNTYDQKTRNFLNTLEDSQGEINQGGANNALNLRQSMANIVRGIQQGIRSGGVALAGMNAMDSGAGDALARAYATVGNNQTGEARGEAATVSDELMRSQGQLNRTKDEGIDDLETYKDTETGRVKSDFGNKLDLLTADAASKGVSGVVQKDLVNVVLDEAMKRLQSIDQTRQERLGGIKSWTPDQIMAEAIRMENNGQVGNAFSVEGPDVNYGGGSAGMSGAPMGQLPIYVKNKDDLAVAPGLKKRTS